MGLIDSHAHLTFPALRDQVDSVFARCREAGVDRILTVGTDLEDARSAVALAEAHSSRVHAIVGFHPHEAEKMTAGSLREMETLWHHPLVVGMGEMGLDYHYDFADRAVQRSVLAQQLALAAAVDKPLVIHSREALEDTIALLVDHGFAGRRVVFHCFTGTSAEADRIAERSWWISFTGVVTFKKSKALQEIARTYPADQLMVETDSPYLSPEPIRRRKPNEPAHLVHTARFLAELRGVSFEVLAAQTEANTRRFFSGPHDPAPLTPGVPCPK